MQDEKVISHDQALRLIDEQIGEQASLALFIERVESGSGIAGLVPFIWVIGILGNPLAPRPPRLNDDVGFYMFGADPTNAYDFPPTAGITRFRDHGVDFLISVTTVIRVAWGDSKDMTSPRSVEDLTSSFPRRTEGS